MRRESVGVVMICGGECCVVCGVCVDPWIGLCGVDVGGVVARAPAGGGVCEAVAVVEMWLGGLELDQQAVSCLQYRTAGIRREWTVVVCWVHWELLKKPAPLRVL